jgi:hypothetical protein
VANKAQLNLEAVFTPCSLTQSIHAQPQEAELIQVIQAEAPFRSEQRILCNAEDGA